MRSASAHLVAAVVLAFATTACEKVRIVGQFDAGPLCAEGERLINGECRFVCDRDGDCAAGERCDLLTGRCAPKPPPRDAGPEVITCTEGAVRCSSDGLALERCDVAGAWTVQQQCPAPDGFCQNEVCLSCRPGATRCGAGGTTAQICQSDGSGWRDITCAAGATCVSGECRECEAGQRRCSPDNHSVQECKRLPREDLSLGYVNAGDNFDGTCITQVCEMGASGPQCRVPACVPGATQCLSATTQQTCSAQGAWQNTLCTSLPGMGPTAECINGACIDECGDAARAKSYFGCEYWATTLDNSMDALFKGNTLSGQGSADSDFVFVVTNQSTLPATVEVWRYQGTAPVRIKQVTVPGRTDTATRGLLKINVPWQSITAASADTGTAATGRARYGYRLTSTRPITVYQFNPIDAFKTTARTCSGTAGQADCGCNEYADYTSSGCGLIGLSCCSPGLCTQTANGKRCGYGTFSNDASLLLPSHILGTGYVAVTPGHSHINDPPNSYTAARSSQVVIVATQDTTVVTVKASAVTLAGPGIAAMAVNETRNFTLNSYDVLALSSATAGPDVECQNFGGAVTWCRKGNDLTGTVITSDKPIAVFGSNPCLNVPWSRPYCDHVEEQVFPFATWGKSFVAVPSHPLRLNDNSFSTSPPPDHFKIVAGAATTLTLTPPPAASAVLAPTNCQAGTSLAANNCQLAGGSYVEFKSLRPFTVTSSNPIAVAQFLPGQGQVQSPPASTDPKQGDPSMILLPPVEQWRSRYTVLASTGLQDNYLALTIDGTKVQSVSVDGAVVTGFAAIAGTNFLVKNHPVGTGTHTIQVTARPGQTTLPGAGVTIYGYDAQVSYGYTGGLDLTTIVTGINPGG
ncbi:MAG: IgGFc-binding protein [Myxococcales bacterium]|nr:IgGFc-binding protein [Myxococcales bacterium]